MPSERRKSQKGGRKPIEEYADYVVAIEDWDWSLMFSISDARWTDEPYEVYRHLELWGRLLGPSFAGCEIASVTLFPENLQARPDQEQQNRALGVGSVSKRGAELECMLTMPADALSAVLVALSTGRLRRVEMHGLRLRYGKALVRSYHLDTHRQWDRTVLD